MASKHRGPRDPDQRGRGSDRPELLEIGPDEGEIFELEQSSHLHALIKVIGVGGGGGNALNTMIQSGLSGVEFIAANTDAQALNYNRASMKLQLGAELTRGLGCGANPEKGRDAALEARDRLREALLGTDMVFVTAGMGGGTGTGAAPIIAEVAREIGALTVGVVTKPFQFEGKVRTRHAERGLDELHRVVDTLITIPNHRLLALAGRNTAVKDSFKLADEVLFNAVKGISDLIPVHGLINLDFADVRTIMNEMGMAMMGTGVGRAENRAADAAQAAISSPLLEDVSIEGAHGILINITGPPDMTLYEVNEASSLVQQAAHGDANIIFGAVVDENMEDDELRVTVIATGLDDGRARRSRTVERNEDLDNVRMLRREREEPPAAPAAEHREEPARAEVREAPPRLETESEDWMSPFEDELDVPAFLRRSSEKREKESDDKELPAFLRRSAD
jgi:cell division protein FtsZ